MVFSGCASVSVSPRSINQITARPDERAAMLKTWNEAVWICNEFLGSEHRKTLPAGKIVLEDEEMAFLTDGVRIPIRIRCSAAGDLLIPFKMIAQERADGFVVGALPPRQHRELDNTFFKHLSGRPKENYLVADMILHELTHMYFKLGTVSLSKTVGYYLEAVFLFRYRSHSMEIIPYRTTAEFDAFVRAHFENQKSEEPNQSTQPAKVTEADSLRHNFELTQKHENVAGLSLLKRAQLCS